MLKAVKWAFKNVYSHLLPPQFIRVNGGEIIGVKARQSYLRVKGASGLSSHTVARYEKDQGNERFVRLSALTLCQEPLRYDSQRPALFEALLFQIATFFNPASHSATGK